MDTDMQTHNHLIKIHYRQIHFKQRDMNKEGNKEELTPIITRRIKDIKHRMHYLVILIIHNSLAKVITSMLIQSIHNCHNYKQIIWGFKTMELVCNKTSL